MKDRPILFSGPMVRAIFDDRKTNTRRVIKNYPEYGIQPCYYSKTGWAKSNERGSCTCAPFPCPYPAKTKLWVRETHHVLSAGYKDGTGREIVYKADDPDFPYGWTPSIFMPKWAARLWLEVVNVRVERLQEISEEDAQKEGVDFDTCMSCGYSYFDCILQGDHHLCRESPIYPRPARSDFMDLWDSINGKKYPWSSNPWVWVIEFKRIRQRPEGGDDERGFKN